MRIGMWHVQVTQQHLRPKREDDGALMVTRSWRSSPGTGFVPEPRGDSKWF